MADLTEFIGISQHTTAFKGVQVTGTWAGNETDYLAIVPADFVNYADTLFFIYEDE